jgi:hypothetical protein
MSLVGLMLVLAGTLSAAPERDQELREKQGPAHPSPIVKFVKHVIRVFGDGLSVPRP